ncbi:cyclic nucleotide-binding domain-containing protein [Chitinophaga sp. SYP-B3965]|uniref:Crp/Fnr family transcriptional regulator n=1 Tax=Chitinophaga sp. SYP-B3965 TaxID=2663120 RepID=UPI001299A0CB|nr:Crp/Fnr family transcriptional regulator [Chitinophaga sp. SYP-B3965]MRG48796.1 cyclic nucleotide-binding domain-containing protein [Chitinophaga sp. SYP-B3965]
MIRKNLQLLQLMETLEGKTIQRNISVGQRLIHQGESLTNVYIIRSGIAKCFITEDNGKDYILEFLGEGEVLGEIEAIRKQQTLCSVEAVTPLVVYIMSNAQFLDLLRTMPDFNIVILELLATRVANSSIKSARQQLYTLSEILPQLLTMLDAQKITFTKQDLAEYVGISVRSLNRLLKEPG